MQKMCWRLIYCKYIQNVAIFSAKKKIKKRKYIIDSLLENQIDIVIKRNLVHL